MNTNNSSNQESLSNDIKALLANSKRLRLPDSMLSIEQARQALSLAEQLPDYEHNSLYLESHIELAAALRYSGFANQALNAIVRASSLLEYYEADDYSIRVHNLLAAIQISLGDYSQALASLDMAHRLAQSNGDLEAEAEALSNMGLTYGWLYQLDLAMEYFQQALKLCDQLESKPAFLVALLGNKAYALFLLNDMTSARSYALRGLELARQTQDRMYEVIILGSLSEIHVAMGDAHIAEAYLEEARQISEASDFLELKTQNLRNWSAFYINTNQFDAAITAFKECLALAEKHDIKPIMDECFQGLASVYEQQNDFASALEYLKSSSKVRETLPVSYTHLTLPTNREV